MIESPKGISKDAVDLKIKETSSHIGTEIIMIEGLTDSVN